jgi:hypothetical protein
LILLLSPSLRQSSELFRKVLDNLRDDADEKPRLVEDSKLFMTLHNGSRIVSLPGQEGTVRSYSAVDLILIDEASRVLDELYYSVRPMLAVSGGRIVLMSTPNGKHKFFYEEWCAGKSQYDYLDVRDNWQRIRIPWNFCPRIPERFIEEERERLPDRWFRQEYECEFLEVEDAAFSTDDIHAAITLTKQMLDDSIVDGGVRPLFNLK